MVNGLIQAFPWQEWKSEFPRAQQIGISLMEWTLDQDRLHHNPLMTPDGRAQIIRLCEEHEVEVQSITGDCFMQAPFWKASGDQAQILKYDFMAVVRACGDLGIRFIVVPLVDNGRLENQIQEDRLIDFLQQQSDQFAKLGLQIIFESDFNPAELARFINQLDSKLFGINYDIGNSAAQGWSPSEEFAAYGQRILNVHVKDRVLGGATVPLGKGSAQFDLVFSELGRLGYKGNYILQTARALDEHHADLLARYRDMTIAWINMHVSERVPVN